MSQRIKESDLKWAKAGAISWLLVSGICWSAALFVLPWTIVTGGEFTMFWKLVAVPVVFMFFIVILVAAKGFIVGFIRQIRGN